MLAPWAQIDEHARIPGRGLVAELLARATDAVWPVAAAPAAPGVRRMTRTKVTTIILLLAAGAVGAAFLESALAASGRPILIPPFTLPAALVAIGVIIVLLALPIRRKVKGTRKAPIDPFYATRVAMLAKASSISGAFLFGGGGGVILYLTTRSVPPAAGSIGMAIGTAGRGRHAADGRAHRRAHVHHPAGERRRRDGAGQRTGAAEVVSSRDRVRTAMSTRLELPETTWRRVSPKLMWAELVGTFVGALFFLAITIPLHLLQVPFALAISIAVAAIG